MTEELFKAYIRFLVAKLAIKLPLLALPVINPIFVWAFTKIATFFYEELTTFVQYKVIDINIYRALVGYNEAWKAIQIETDKTKIPQLRIEYNEKLKNLISFNSSFIVRSQS